MNLDPSRALRPVQPSCLGIFAKTFPRETLEDVFSAVAAHGLSRVQYNLACAGLPTLPDDLPAPELLSTIRRAAHARGIVLEGLSGTFNMIHPDLAERAEGLRRLAFVMQSARSLGIPVVTLCTGTRDPQDMWRGHPDNHTADAWRDLLHSMEIALRLAHEHNVSVAVEPESGNVMDSAPATRRLLDELRSPRLRVILDPANLPQGKATDTGRRVIDEALELLTPEIIMAHAKEIGRDGQLGGVALGRGILDWAYYVQRLGETGFAGPLIMHGFDEKDAAASHSFLRDKLRSLTKT